MPLILPTADPSPLPNGPLARFLAHPDASLHALEHRLGHVALLAAYVGLRLVVVAGLLAAVGLAARRLRRRGGDVGGYVELLVPPEVDPSGAVVFWRRVHAVISGRRFLGGPRRVVFELAGSPGSVRIGLWAPPGVPGAALAKAAGAAWPGVVAAVTGTPPSPLGEGRVSGGVLRLAAPEWFGFSPEGNPEPLRGVIAELADCAHGETAVVQIVVAAATGRRLHRARRAAVAIRAGRPVSGLARLLDAWNTKPAAGVGSGDPMRSADVRAITAKLADSPGWEVTVRYGVAGPASSRGGRRRLRSRARMAGASFGVYAGRNWLHPVRLRSAAAVIGQRRAGRGQLMGTTELAALAHLPVERLAALSEAGAAPVAPPPAAYFGDDDDAF